MSFPYYWVRTRPQSLRQLQVRRCIDLRRSEVLPSVGIFGGIWAVLLVGNVFFPILEQLLVKNPECQ
jgi:hypothetical protein